ncbi:MAG: type II secretion system F family protein [Candidatus Omnitrophica bacterium]|nr:type II secretion system F family protein [Candidatus Omnitrophota bacterium]
MPVYLYRAKKGPQEVVEGKIEALTEKEAVEKLTQLGYLPIKIQPLLSKEKQLQKSIPGKINPHQITVFSRQLATLLKSGVPILTAINILQQQSQNSGLSYILFDLYNSIKEGQNFSTVLAKYPKVFSSLYTALIKTAEDSGALAEVLFKVSDYRARQEEFLSKFRMALVYPILMVLVGIGTIIFMLTFVLPKISRIFLDLGQNLPLPTQIILGLSNFLKEKWLWLVISILIVLILFHRYFKTEKGRTNLDSFKLKLPLLGNFILKAELARFSRTLELLIKNGISILKAIELAIPVLNNQILKNCFKTSIKELQQGSSLGKVLKEYKIIPIFMSNLISVGEESGRLSEAFAEVASSYEQDNEDTAKVFTTLLEPALILIIGGVIGFIVIGMLLPIFEINLAIR